MKRLIYLLFTLTVVACSEYGITDQQFVLPTSPNIKTRSGGDGKYDLLGYGYDVTGQYFVASSAKAKVIDVDAFEMAHSDRVDENIFPNSYGHLFIGESAEDYTSNLSKYIKLEIYSDSDSISGFKGQLEESFANSEHYSAKYSIASYSLNIRQKQLYMTAPLSMLSQYLTTKFRDDLNTQSMEYIVQNYGTHVLTNITLGARLDILYRSLVTSSNKKETVESGFSYKVTGVFGLNTGGHTDTSLLLNNSEQEINYRTIGGDPSLSLIGNLNVDSQNPTPVNISNWQASCNTSTMTLIDVEPGSVIPIYDLVEDNVKKIQLKKAVEDYMRERSYIDGGTLVSLYQYSYLISVRNGTKKSYYYTTDFSEYGLGRDGYTYEKTICSIFSSQDHPSGAIPLYAYECFQKNTGNTYWFYTLNFSRYGMGWTYVNNYIKYKGILCYVYPNNVTYQKAIPVYRLRVITTDIGSRRGYGTVEIYDSSTIYESLKIKNGRRDEVIKPEVWFYGFSATSPR